MCVCKIVVVYTNLRLLISKPNAPCACVHWEKLASDRHASIADNDWSRIATAASSFVAAICLNDLHTNCLYWRVNFYAKSAWCAPAIAPTKWRPIVVVQWARLDCWRWLVHRFSMHSVVPLWASHPRCCCCWCRSWCGTTVVVVLPKPPLLICFWLSLHCRDLPSPVVFGGANCTYSRWSLCCPKR